MSIITSSTEAGRNDNNRHLETDYNLFVLLTQGMPTEDPKVFLPCFASMASKFLGKDVTDINRRVKRLLREQAIAPILSKKKKKTRPQYYKKGHKAGLWIEKVKNYFLQPGQARSCINIDDPCFSTKNLDYYTGKRIDVHRIFYVITLGFPFATKGYKPLMTRPAKIDWLEGYSKPKLVSSNLSTSHGTYKMDYWPDHPIKIQQNEGSAGGMSVSVWFPGTYVLREWIEKYPKGLKYFYDDRIHEIAELYRKSGYKIGDIEFKDTHFAHYFKVFEKIPGMKAMKLIDEVWVDFSDGGHLETSNANLVGKLHKCAKAVLDLPDIQDQVESISIFVDNAKAILGPDCE